MVIKSFCSVTKLFLVSLVIIFVLIIRKKLYKNNEIVAMAEEEFEQAWINPAYTQIELNDVDINKILTEHYRITGNFNFTQKMLWDMEIKKAVDPKVYIPYVVQEGKSWGRQHFKNGDEILVRSSTQKQWLNDEKYEEVFEKVYINHKDKKITFIFEQENPSILKLGMNASQLWTLR